MRLRGSWARYNMSRDTTREDVGRAQLGAATRPSARGRGTALHRRALGARHAGARRAAGAQALADARGAVGARQWLGKLAARALSSHPGVLLSQQAVHSVHSACFDPV